MTENLLARLEQWANACQILPGSNFACTSYDDCNKRHGHDLRGGGSVRMSYIGQKYGQTDFEPAVRLAIVGIDHGYGFTDFRSTQREIIDVYQRRGRRFNPHYRGVVKTAAGVFGSRTACQRCAEENRCQLRERKGDPCVLDMFAQPNLVKCASGPNATSRTTPVMMRKCSQWLMEELERLTPTLIIFHGAKADRVFREAEQRRGWTELPVPGDTTRKLHRLVNAPFQAEILYLHHPSRGHLERQWEPIAKPAFGLLREMGKIPM